MRRTNLLIAGQVEISQWVLSLCHFSLTPWMETDAFFFLQLEECRFIQEKEKNLSDCLFLSFCFCLCLSVSVLLRKLKFKNFSDLHRLSTRN